MLATFGALAPVFLLIALGWALRARGFPGDHFWPAAERLVYFVLFPALLFLTTAGADLRALDLLPLAAALIAAIGATVALSLALRPLLKMGDAAFTSVLQGGIRCNTYVGLAAGSALFGEVGLSVMGLVVFVVVTTVNLVSVVALTHYGRRAAGRRIGTRPDPPCGIPPLRGTGFSGPGSALSPMAGAPLGSTLGDRRNAREGGRECPQQRCPEP